MTGIPVEETVGKRVHASLGVDNQRSLADLIIEDPDSVGEKFSDSILSKTDTGYFEVEMSLPSIKGGIRAIISVIPILDRNGLIKGAIETIQDVTNLQEGTYRVYDSPDRTIESPSNPIFKIDSKGKISSWNKACEENFGYPSSMMIGDNSLRFVSKSTRPSFKETITRVLKGESFTGKEWKYYSAQGEPVYVLARAFPIQASKGKPKECVIVNTDITELKSKMRRLEQDAAEAKEKLKNVTGEFALLRKNIASYIRKK
jgi:PAS domain S-box-containing protein